MTKQTSKTRNQDWTLLGRTGLCWAGLSESSNEVTSDLRSETNDSLKTEAKREEWKSKVMINEVKTGDKKKI